MTSAEKNYQREVDQAAKEFSGTQEGNSYLAYHAAVAWSRRHPSPECEAVAQCLRKCLQSKAIETRLEYTSERVLEAYEAKKEEKWS